METLHPKAGFGSQTNLSGHTAPATPPYTPAKHKRRFERSDSPASSIHPTETSSPAKKVLKRTGSDSILVVELPEGDLDELESLLGPEVEVVSPAELEEAEDYLTESQDDDTDDSDSDSGISSRFEKLSCGDREEESEMTKKRRERRLSKRTSSRVFKRPHSQSANSDTEVTDTDAVDDRSRTGSVKRLRRRVHDALVGTVDLEEWRSSPEPSGRKSAEQPSESHQGEAGDGASTSEVGNDHMES